VKEHENFMKKKLKGEHKKIGKLTCNFVFMVFSFLLLFDCSPSTLQKYEDRKASEAKIDSLKNDIDILNKAKKDQNHEYENKDNRLSTKINNLLLKYSDLSTNSNLSLEQIVQQTLDKIDNDLQFEENKLPSYLILLIQTFFISTCFIIFTATGTNVINIILKKLEPV